MTSRWVLKDVETLETWTMPLNPNAMSSPHQDKQIETFAGGVRSGLTGVRSFETAPQAKEWTWSGVIRSKNHYDSLAQWARVPGKVWVTDHLGRTFEVLIRQFDPEDRKPTGTLSWRLNYTMRVLLLRRIS